MSANHQPTSVIVLFGPTALGKTEIALGLAERIGAEIVSADSMQVYAGLPILTNQPTPEQLTRVPHHLVGFQPPTEEFSVAQYARLAHATIDDVLARGKRVIIEGGSGLYVRAALGGLHFGSPPSAARPRLEERAATDLPALVADLEKLDPATAASIDRRNPRRVVRALELVTILGRPLTAAERSALWHPGTRYAYRLFALEPDRARLRERLEARVDQMLAQGLVEEVAALPNQLSRTVRQAIGVREVLAYLAGEISLAEASAAMKQRTRAYVRRQLTWMRKLPDADTIAVAQRSAEEIAAEIAEATS